MNGPKACNYDKGDCCTGIKGVNCNVCECKQNSTDYPLITTEFWDPGLSEYAINLVISYVYIPIFRNRKKCKCNSSDINYKDKNLTYIFFLQFIVL